MPLSGLRSAGQRETLVASAARTTSSDSGALDGYGPAVRAVVQLDVTAASGTSPTLDVVVEDTVDGTNYNTVATFAQKVAAGREAVRVTTPFSDTLRVRWTIAGTTPSFTFSVKAYFEADNAPLG